MENIPITNIDVEHYKQNTFDFYLNGYLKMEKLMFQNYHSLSKYLQPFMC